MYQKKSETRLNESPLHVRQEVFPLFPALNTGFSAGSYTPPEKNPLPLLKSTIDCNSRIVGSRQSLWLANTRPLTRCNAISCVTRSAEVNCPSKFVSTGSFVHISPVARSVIVPSGLPEEFMFTM